MLSDPFLRLSDPKLGDEKVRMIHVHVHLLYVGSASPGMLGLHS